MRRLLVALLLIATAGAAVAGEMGNSPGAAGSAKPPHPPYIGPDPSGPRQGGDTIAGATVITGLPYSDSGTTDGYVNDYDETCPYSGSTSPDVVYSYTPTVDICIDIDLCTSGYDTKVYVYENSAGNLIACNDDFTCALAYRSKIEALPLSAGSTYYIVIDGYHGASGGYTMSISATSCHPWPPPPPFFCPQDALLECESACVDGYVDSWDGGCDGVGWVLIEGQDDTGCATLCGWSCTYVYGGIDQRDTDWYEFIAGAGGVALSVVGEFPIEVILFYDVIDCNSYSSLSSTADAYQSISLGHSMPEGTTSWCRVSSSAFSGVPESLYILSICGIRNGPMPTYSGACCDPHTAFCTMETEAACATAGGLFIGTCVYCEPNPCPPPISGACCLVDGTCLVLPPSDCANAAGAYMGDDTVCAAVTCEPTPVETTTWGALKKRYR